jgi:hypothetical protein
VVANHRNARLAEGVDDGLVDGEHRLVAPQLVARAHVEPERRAHRWEHIVAARVRQVAEHLRVGEPAHKGHGGEKEAAHGELHAAHYGEAEPAQRERVQAGHVRVPDGHDGHVRRGQLEERGRRALIHLQQQRQSVPRRARRRRHPAEALNERRRERSVGGLAEHAAAHALTRIARKAQQRAVPHARALCLVRAARAEDAHARRRCAARNGALKEVQDGRKGARVGRHVPAVGHRELHVL